MGFPVNNASYNSMRCTVNQFSSRTEVFNSSGQQRCVFGPTGDLGQRVCQCLANTRRGRMAWRCSCDKKTTVLCTSKCSSREVNQYLKYDYIKKSGGIKSPKPHHYLGMNCVVRTTEVTDQMCHVSYSQPPASVDCRLVSTVGTSKQSAWNKLLKVSLRMVSHQDQVQ